MSNPWHAECHHCGAWLVPPRSTICAECEDKQNAYANVMIKRQKENPLAFYDDRDDMTTDGRNIRTTEANHRMLTRISREKPE